jgi:DNA-binding PadR family transcriptional regulator
VVQNLEKYGFIEVDSTEREGRQPERTTYRITEAGKAELQDWMRDLLSVPGEETSGFAAALSEAGGMHPDEIVQLLTTRLTRLDAANAAEQAGLESLAERLPRLFLIESEYQLAMRVAEAGWVRGLIDEIVTGTLSGVDAWRKFRDTGEVPDTLRQLLDEEATRRWEEPDM